MTSTRRIAKRIALCSTALIVCQLPFILLLIVEDGLLSGNAKGMLYTGLGLQLSIAIFMICLSQQLASAGSSSLAKNNGSWRSNLSS